MRYGFLIDTYETERLKVVSVWSMFHDDDLSFRPSVADGRARSLLEQMVHQCVSEDLWFRRILGIDVQARPLPVTESRLNFIQRYSEDSGKRLRALRLQTEAWWEQPVTFFDVERSRAWVFVRRIAHTSHHRGQQMTMLRVLNRDVYSNYGPTTDTGGLMQNGAAVIYAYPDVEALILGESAGGAKSQLPRLRQIPVTERPGRN